MIVIGITGSIGMGKTTAANMLREMSVPVYDSDAAVHQLIGPGGAAVDDVDGAFPGVRMGDHIDRQALGRIVFADRALKKKLEEILHPRVRADADAFKAEMKKRGHKIAALDIPLLFETDGMNRVDVTIVVTAPLEQQKERVLSRPGMTAQKFDRIVRGQMTDAEKQKRANYVVNSGGTLEELREQLEQIVKELEQKA